MPLPTSLRIAVASLLLAGTSLSAQSAPALAQTPPMGWNSWNHFAGKVTDATIRETADLMVSTGMRDAGYVYVNIDDTWQGKRDAQGRIQANEKFPDMKGLADYVHSKGLKIGIYSGPGAQTCAKYEGSMDHEQQDADTYAAWGMDFLKYDLCSYGQQMKAAAGDDPAKTGPFMEAAYRKMHEALLHTGRPIVFSLCQYGLAAVWRWGASVGGNLWRTTGDIQDNYNSMSQIGFSQAGLAPFAGPGHWNDPDMLEVGNGGMSTAEYQTHMTLWSMLAAPLLAGNDLTKMTPEIKDILLNREVIAIDQDRLGRSGDRVYAEGPLEVWSKPLADGARAVAVFNRARQPMTLDVPLSKLGLQGSVKARDLWTHQDIAALHTTWHVALPSHGVVLLRIDKSAK